MVTFRTRGRWWLGGAIATALVVSLAALWLRPMLERAVRARIESAAVRHGMVARIGLVHVKYQSSFAHGTPGPGLRSLIDDLLAKLRSVHAIGEEEFQQALGEPIVVAGGRPPG